MEMSLRFQAGCLVVPIGHRYLNPKPYIGRRTQLSLRKISCCRNPTLSCSSASKRPSHLLKTLTASAFLFFLGFGGRRCLASNPTPSLVHTTALVQPHPIRDNEQEIEECENSEQDIQVRAAFESWKSKTYALTVPLRLIALQNSVLPLWIKNFLQSQGTRVKLRLDFRANLGDILSEVSMAFSKRNVTANSAVLADAVTLGDTWFSSAISKKLIEPMLEVEDQEWFRGLSDKWKVGMERTHVVSSLALVVGRLPCEAPRNTNLAELLSKGLGDTGQGCGESVSIRCFASSTPKPSRRYRNDEGKLDSGGKVWAAPYRWGCVVIAYKKSKFLKHKLAPLEDWADLWRPDLAGKISMIDSPREVVGAVLKYMGASYNTSNIDSEVAGGRIAVQDKLERLSKQVRLFDSANYLKAFSLGDVWVAVGWSSDVLPAAKRISDVAVIVPKSGTSLWADLWAIPAVPNIKTNKLGGRLRGPSPLLHQWIEFCMQPERALLFEEEVIAGASPFALERPSLKEPDYISKRKPKLDTNLIAGVPPADILTRCEFLEPLSDTSLLDYQWLISSMQKPHVGLIQKLQQYVSSIQTTFS